MGLQQVYIAGSDVGLQLNKKPYLLTDKAWSKLENAYVWRDRVVKRQGLKLLGRLTLIYDAEPLGNSSASPWSFNLYASLTPPIVPGTTGELSPGSVTITIQAAPDIIFNDEGNGILSSTTADASGIINYVTGDVVLTSTTTPIAGFPTIVSFSYFPGLPVMGIPDREVASVNDEETIFFDTKYAYRFVGAGFQEFSAGTTWGGTDADFFWSTNYRGSNAYDRLFFTTNFVNDAADPMRYTDGNTWTTFAPAVGGVSPTGADNTFIFSAAVLIPYYGRLLAFNTWEGTDQASSQNYFNRCRFSQIGNPIQTTVVGPPFVGGAWRSDVFGKGGFIDAPTNEAIISAIFFKNTLIVYFERSTWQLRYVGEYGLPFIWERISSDFGSESKMSAILFDEGVAAVGDKAIISSNSVTVDRIDQQIPDIVFGFRNEQQGIERVNGIRDFQRQLVFWNYSESTLGRKFPNRVLVYNYINSCYAIFRDNVTAFGTFQPNDNITWDSLTTFWYNDNVLWDDFDTQSLFPNIVVGNQQGFIHYYGYTSMDDPSLSITGFTGGNPITLTVINHNLESEEIVLLSNMNFLDSVTNLPVVTDLNDRIFQVQRIDENTITLREWNGSIYVDDYVYSPSSGANYVGGGKLTLFPVMDIQTKDFNPYAADRKQVKISSINLLTDVPGNPDAALSVELLLNSSPVAVGNVIVGNKEVEQYLPTPYYLPESDYAWHTFFATSVGQYIKIRMFYDDILMNEKSTHMSSFVLNAIGLNVRPGGKINF